MPRISASKKRSSPPNRIGPTSPGGRDQWRRHQHRVDPARVVFSDETWTKTNMAPLRGWAPRGARLRSKVPWGHWNTMTFIAALRVDRIDAPWLLDGPINSETFLAYVTHELVPTLSANDIVIADNLGSHKSSAVRKRYRTGRCPPDPAAEILARSEPDRAGLRQTQATAQEGSRAKPRGRVGRHCRATRLLHVGRVRQLLQELRIRPDLKSSRSSSLFWRASVSDGDPV